MDPIEPLQSPPTIFNYDSMNEGEEEEKEEEKEEKERKEEEEMKMSPPNFTF